MDKYAELREAVESATAGRWYTKTECQARCCWHVFSQVELCGEDVDTPIVMWKCREADAKFMALARNVLPALLSERDSLKHDVEQYVGIASEQATEISMLRATVMELVDAADGRFFGGKKDPDGTLQSVVKAARAALAQGQGEKHDNQD